MLFQMVFEKIAKAVLARTDRNAFIACIQTHNVVGRFVRIIKNNAEYTFLRNRWKGVLPVLTALERFHPALADTGHLEYPWEENNSVRSPAELQIVKSLEDPKESWSADARRFARELLNQFDQIFE